MELIVSNRWLPTKENVNKLISKIDPDKLYHKQMIKEELGIANTVIDRYFMKNSLFIAKTKVEQPCSGRFKFVFGRDLISHLERLLDGREIIWLFDLYYNKPPEEFYNIVGKTKDEVFAKGNYLEIGGWFDGERFIVKPPQTRNNHEDN